MKPSFNFNIHAAAACLVLLLCASPAAAQDERGRLRLEGLDRLAPQAVETVRVELDGGLISFGCAMLSDGDPEERAVKEMCAGLKGVYVRGLEFKAAGQLGDADLAALREQLRAPAWSRLVDIGRREEGLEKAEVYAASEGGRIHGLVLLFVDQKELTVINVVGHIELDKLRRLTSVLNLPKVRVERKRRDVNRP